MRYSNIVPVHVPFPNNHSSGQALCQVFASASYLLIPCYGDMACLSCLAGEEIVPAFRVFSVSISTLI